MSNVVLIGAGKWGQNYINTLSLFPNINLKIANKNNWKNLIDEKPDHVIVSTQPDSHIEIAEYIASKNISMVIEKPLSFSLKEAEKLKNFSKTILVNYTYLFSSGYERIKNTTDVNKISKITINMYGKGPQRKYSSLWDYGPHCFAMLLDIMEEMPQSIYIKEIQNITGSLYEVLIKFNSVISFNIIGNGGVEKHRDIKIENVNGAFSFYDNINDLPTKNDKSPLYQAMNVFINNQNDKRFGLELSFKVLKLLEACEQSLKDKTTIYLS